jgi:hypothetical protein
MKIPCKPHYLLVLIFQATSCGNFLENELPETEVTEPQIYATNENAKAAVRGIYMEMASSNTFTNGSIALLTGMSSDELDMSPNTYDGFQTNRLQPDENNLLVNIWIPAYRYVYMTNAVLHGLEHSSGVTNDVRQQLEGEALFIRAFCHFYLTNLFGPVPYITSTDSKKNAKVFRENSDLVFENITADLLSAKKKLTEDYSLFQGARIQATKWAASALLARVYLFRNDWTNSEAEASNVIEQSGLFELNDDISQVFLSNSKEAIWQLLTVIPGAGTMDALTFLPRGTQPVVCLTEELVSDLEANDKRHLWIDSIVLGQEIFRHPAKYRDLFGQSEQHTELRLAEIYLIRAEARARRGKLNEAINDLDTIRKRAGVPLYSESEIAFKDDEIVNLVIDERRLELFTEGGHRWFDLVRTEMASTVLKELSEKDWQDTDKLYPVPQSEINNNKNLLPQNKGY